jgi:hypothetical protein
LIKKQGNRKANIKKTKRIRRGGGGREKQGEEKKVSKGTYPVVLAYPVGEWRGDVECRRALKVMILRQIWSAYKGDPKWGRGGVLHHGVQLSDEMLAKDCISIVVPPPRVASPPPQTRGVPPLPISFDQ